MNSAAEIIETEEDALAYELRRLVPRIGATKQAIDPGPVRRPGELALRLVKLFGYLHGNVPAQLSATGVDTRPMQIRTTSTSCREPGAATTDNSSGLESRLTWTPIALEVEILAALEAPKQDSETLDAAFVRKEHEIGAVLSRLTPADSLALERRLTLSLAGDPIAARFARLMAARRKRLVSFISEMRHRRPSSVVRAGARHG